MCQIEVTSGETEGKTTSEVLSYKQDRADMVLLDELLDLGSDGRAVKAHHEQLALSSALAGHSAKCFACCRVPVSYQPVSQAVRRYTAPDCLIHNSKKNERHSHVQIIPYWVHRGAITCDSHGCSRVHATGPERAVMRVALSCCNFNAADSEGLSVMLQGNAGGLYRRSPRRSYVSRPSKDPRQLGRSVALTLTSYR